MSNFNQRSRGNYGGGGNYSRGGGGNYEDRQGHQNTYPNSGALFPVKQKRSDNSPDLTGRVTISEDVLDYIVRKAQEGGEIELELSAWLRISRNNTNFTSLKINIPYDVRQAEQGNPTYHQSGGRQGGGRRDERQAYSQPQTRGNYAQASGREDRAPQVPDYLRPDPRQNDNRRRDLDDEIPF